MRYLLDTNHLGAATQDKSTLGRRIAEETTAGHRFGTIVPVLGETLTGLLNAHQPDRAERRLREFLRLVRVWPLEVVDGFAFGTLSHTLRTRGRVLAAVDILLAVVALRMKATLLTTDRDFEALPEVPTENWLVEPEVEP